MNLDFHLNEKSAEDLKYISELKRMGVPDEIIEIAYENTKKKRKEKSNENSR